MPLSEPPRKMLANKSNLSVRVPLLHSFWWLLHLFYLSWHLHCYLK